MLFLRACSESLSLIPLRANTFQWQQQRWLSAYSNAQDSALRHKESRSGKNQKYLAFNKIQERIEFLQKNQTRNWKAGDVYSPRDLGSTEMKKWRKRQSPTMDAFDAMGVNPLHLYKNFSVMSEYMSDMGRIKHSSETGLRPVNQRRMAKAIRRAIGLGLMPTVYKHPEVIAADIRKKTDRYL